jgi:predicted nucleic acid-binding protein
MSTLVDSDVWSEALRKKGKKSAYVEALKKLIRLDEVVMIGSIRQEVLSGIREEKRFDEIRELLKPFRSEKIDDSIYELAASFFNLCRSKGIQGSHTDFLMCACSVAWKIKILSKDKDFRNYSKCLPIDLIEVNG